MPFAAVTGLAAEARIARRVGLRTAATGGDAERTRATAARLLAEGASGLLSFGICGGLDPALAAGALILPRAVGSETGERHLADPAMHRALAAALDASGHAPATGDILGMSAIADSVERKMVLFRRSGAVAVDNESHLVAAAAAAAGIPFLVLRAVADPAVRGLPPAALVGLDPEGRPALGPVLRSLLARPGQLPALLRAALDARHALQALRRSAGALGVLLGERVS
jgi:hopanoid-associated phosphorylase